MNGVYTSVDKMTTDELDRLEREEGVSPSCQLGCSHCCRYHIPLSSAESHVLGKYVKREFSADQIHDLRLRTQQWHAWDDMQRGGCLPVSSHESVDLTDYVPGCPMLVNGVCSIYPVRPLVCRLHYVSSPPWSCQAVHDTTLTEDPPISLTTVATAGDSYAEAIEDYVEGTGKDYSRSILLLPHGLAMEMDWDFALTR